MALLTIRFVQEGSEPKSRRNTRSAIEFDKIKAQVSAMPEGQSVLVEFDGTSKTEASTMVSKFNKSLKPGAGLEAYKADGPNGKPCMVVKRVKVAPVDAKPTKPRK